MCRRGILGADGVVDICSPDVVNLCSPDVFDLCSPEDGLVDIGSPEGGADGGDEDDFAVGPSYSYSTTESELEEDDDDDTVSEDESEGAISAVVLF